MRVMDCYLFEGPKVLYRIALAILICYHKHATLGKLFLSLKDDWQKFL